jgi:hypothetical protein
VGAAGINFTESASFNQPGYLKIVICSSPENYSDVDYDADPVQPPECNDKDFAGKPGNFVKIAVFFNHGMLMPFISSIWPHLPLMATREMIVETYKNPRDFGESAAVVTATPAPTNTPAAPGPCSGISFSTDWTLTSEKASIWVNNSGVDRKLDRAVFDWGNYDAYALTQSVTELKWGDDPIFVGLDPNSTTNTGDELNRDFKSGETKIFTAIFQEEDGDLPDFFEPGDFGLGLYFTNGCELFKPTTHDSPPQPPTHESGPEGEIFFISEDYPSAYAHAEWSTNDDGSVTTRTTFSFDFVDNTYGENAVGWEDSKKGTHTFGELVGSDHVRLNFYNGNGELFFDAKVDYISSSGSGYGTLGVTDGDGKIYVGDESMVYNVRTSLSENFNTLDCELTVDSPSIEDPVECPDWDFNVWYEVTLSPDAFAEHGFAYPDLTFIHASPAKISSSTVLVYPGPKPMPTAETCFDC